MVYDLIVLGILLFAAWRGAAKGMAWQLATIASLVLCFVFATPLSAVVAPYIKVDPPLNRWIAMLAIYLVFSLVCFGVARAVRDWLEKAKFVEYDRHLGAMFGVLKGALFCFVMTFFLVCMNDSMADYIVKTKSGYATAVIVQNLHVVMPAEIVDMLRPHLKKLPPPNLNGDEGEPDELAEKNDASAPRNKYRPKNEFRGTKKPSPPADGPVVTPAESGDKGLSLESLVDQVSGLVGKKVEESLKESVSETLPKTGQSEPPKQPQPARKADPAERAKLQAEIAKVFTSSPEVQEAFIDDMQASLQDVPEAAAVGALRDWRADLLGQSGDPDPGTDVETSLDRRIYRQLQKTGVSLSTLPESLRRRLQGR